jgi:ethanolamine ammonia-lyase large subunit
MGLLQKAKAAKSKCKGKAAKSVSVAKVVLKKITTEELKNARIVSYEYIL